MSHASIFLLVVALCICMSNALFEKNRVMIGNVLQHNKYLKVHCKSKDDDLGFHLLAPGEIYDFTFRDNVLRSTLFWCNLWQGPHYKHHQVFEAYRALGVPRFGQLYIWEAREDGIYFDVDKDHAMLRYGWDVPHDDTAPSSFEDENLSPN